MKKTLLFLAALGGLLTASAEGSPDYTSGLENLTNTHSGRSTTKLVISDGTSSTEITDIQSSTNKSVFFDKTAITFSVHQGYTVTITPTASGSWMQNCVFIDWGNDGFDAPNLTTDFTGHVVNPGVDLVFSQGYMDGNTWYNSKGGTLQNGGESMSAPCIFDIPEDATPGTYRARYMVDWNNLDPNNPKSDIGANGGIIVDFTIKVIAFDREEAQKIYVSAGTVLRGAADILTPAKKSDLDTRYNSIGSDDITIEKVAELNAILNEAYSDLDRKIVYAYNHRNAKYFTANNDGSNSVEANKSNAAKWEIIRNGSNNNFRLMSVHTLKEIAATPSQQANANSGRLFEIGWSTSTDGDREGGTALKYADVEDDAITIGWQADVAHGWGCNDGGASWTLSLAAVTKDNLITDGSSYYRIRSARALANNRASLVGINLNADGALGDLREQKLRTIPDGLGALWTITAADEDGKVYIRNAAADYEGEETCFAIGSTDPATHHTSSSIVSNAHAVPVEILTGTGTENFSRNIPHALCIRTYSSGSTHYYMDNQNSGEYLPKFNGWNTVDNNFPDNGGIYYFEPVDEEEVAPLVEAYCSASTSKGELFSSDFTWTLNFPIFFTQEDFDNTVASLNQIENASSARDFNTSIFTPINQYLSSANDKIFLAENIERNSGSGHYISYSDGPASFQNISYSNFLGVSSDKTALTSMWTLKHAGNGTFYMQNYGNNRYVAKNETYNQPYATVTSEEEATGFYLETYTVNSETVVAFSFDKTEDSYMHELGSGDGVVRWKNPVKASASGWRLYSLVDEAQSTEYVESTIEENQITLALSNGQLSKHESYAPHHNIVISPKTKSRAAAEPISIHLGSDQVSVGDDGKVIVKFLPNEADKLDVGDYNITIPAAAFKTSDGKVTAPASYSFTVNDGGGVTSIDDIEATEAQPAAIYDLQGRRLAAPVKGINIINGKKVLIR